MLIGFGFMKQNYCAETFQSNDNFQEMPGFHWLLTLGMHKAQDHKIIVTVCWCPLLPKIITQLDAIFLLNTFMVLT